MFDTSGLLEGNVTLLVAKELIYSLQTLTGGSGQVLVPKLDQQLKGILVIGVIPVVSVNPNLTIVKLPR